MILTYCNLNVSSFIDKLVEPIVSLQFHKTRRKSKSFIELLELNQSYM